MNLERGAALRESYQREVREGRFREDPAQLLAIERLEELRGRLIEAVAASDSLAQRMLRLAAGRAPESVRGLYLWGGVGRGKTWLMDAFYRSLPFPERRRSHFHRFMHEVHGRLARLKRRTTPLAVIAEQIAARTRVLCLDELFVSDIADAMILSGLFSGLSERGVTFVITSNTPPSELYRNGLQRQKFLPAIGILETHTEVLAVNGAVDYRLRQLAQAGTYLDSTAPHSAARLAALFDALSGDASSTAGAIKVAGRSIPVIRDSESVVWFDFAAICVGARSVDDYIEIARAYQSVLISDVPELHDAASDPVRRFVALIDELYDHRVNLVLSAAAPAHLLYKGERLRQEFQRAASRLVEMQSEEYLSREHRP